MVGRNSPTSVDMFTLNEAGTSKTEKVFIFV